MMNILWRCLVIISLLSLMYTGPSITDGSYGSVRSTIMTLRTSFEGSDVAGALWEGSGDGISLGLSTGDEHIVVFDPERGAPMIDWIATTLTLPGSILSVKSVRGQGRPMVLQRPIMGMVEATSPYEQAEPVSPWRGNGIYPADPVRHSRIGYRMIDGELHSVYSLWICPLTLGEGGEATTYKTTEIHIEWEEERVPARSSGSPQDVPGTVSITPYMEIPPSYIIITGEGLVSTLEPLARWRSGGGIPTSIVAVKDILLSYPDRADPADAVREYLRDVHYGWGTLEYVLLAGDWDVVPTKRVLDSNPYPGWDDGYLPADSYYACLDGTWDLDGDEIYAEVGDLEDIIPDISVSRLAINEPSVWEEKIEQIIEYELGPEDLAWSGRAVMIAAHTHSEGDGPAHSEYLWNKHLSGLYADKVELYESDMDLNVNAVDAALGAGSGFVQFIDHGGPTVWCDNYGAGVIYRDRDAAKLENGAMLPLASTLACLTTWFDDSSGSQQWFGECIGESFTENTRGGAAGYAGSSRTSVGILGMNTYLPYVNGLQEDLARQVGGLGEYMIGTAFTNGKAHYAEVWGGQFKNNGNPEVSLCWIEYNILGETALELWTGPAGSLEVDIRHENDLDPHVIVEAKDNENRPVPGVNVTLENFEMGVFANAVTDEFGEAAFDLDLQWFCEINVSARKHDHRPVITAFRVSDTIPPSSMLTTDPEEPDGSNGWFHTPVSVSIVPNEKGIVHCRIGSGADMELDETNDFTFNLTEEGEFQLHYFAEDEARNLEAERHHTIRIDLTPPGFDLIVSPEAPDGKEGYYISEPMITIGTMQDGGSAVDAFLSLDGGPFEIYEGPIFVPDGPHVLRVKATDASGRESNISEMAFLVDSTPPDASHILSPSAPDGQNGWYRSNPLLVLDASEEGSIVQYRLDSRSGFEIYVSPLRMLDGSNTLQYRAVDMAGNIGLVHTLTILVDAAPPVLETAPLPEEPDGRNGIYVTAPSIVLKGMDHVGCEVHYRLDGGHWNRYSAPFVMPEGEHELEAFAVDAAGGKSPLFRRNFLVDTIPPTATMEISGERRNGIFRSAPIISLGSDEEAEIYYVFEGNPQLYDGMVPMPGEEGIYVLRYHAVDVAGNVGEFSYAEIRYDPVAPRLDVEVIRREGDTFIISMGRTTDAFEVEFRVMEGKRVLSDWSPETERVISAGSGRHILTVEARDAAGNTASQAVTISVANRTWIPLVGGLILVAAAISGAALIIRRREKGRNDGGIPEARVLD